jgi:hypothetical protein
VHKEKKALAKNGEQQNMGKATSPVLIPEETITDGPRRQGAKIQAEIVKNMMMKSFLNHKWKRKEINLERFGENLKSLTTPCKEAWISRNEGRNQAGDSASAHAGKASRNSKELSPRGCGHAGHVTESPTQLQHKATTETAFQTSGSPFSGPVLAYIEKSIKEAHRESRAMKRKHKDETPITSTGELSIVLAKFNDETSDVSKFGIAKRGRLDDVETKNSDGSGLAEVGV